MPPFTKHFSDETFLSSKETFKALPQLFIPRTKASLAPIYIDDAVCSENSRAPFDENASATLEMYQYKSKIKQP